MAKMTNYSIKMLFFALLFFVGCQSKQKAEQKINHEVQSIYPRGLTCHLNSSLQTQSRQCPSTSGRVILPRTHKPIGIVVGYYVDKDYSDYVKKLISIAGAQSPPIPVSVLVSDDQVALTHSVFESFTEEPYRDYVNLIPLAAQDTLWAQDFLKMAYDIDKKRPLIVDLPYSERDSETSPHALSMICKLPLIKQPEKFSVEPDSGDYGGNILPFPGGVVAVGSNMTVDIKNYLKSHFKQQDFVSLDLDWLETGHVDEILTLIPSSSSLASGKEKTENCSFAILYSSPEQAMELIEESGVWDKALPEHASSVFQNEDLERTDFTECFKNSKSVKNRKCRALWAANKVYEKKVLSAVNRLKSVLLEKNSCQKISVVGLPQLFAPEKVKKTYGEKNDLARAINPNVVNNILLGKDIIVAQQSHSSFQSFVDLKLREEGLVPHFVDSSLVHYSSGGLHCATSVIRGCR